MCPCTGAKDRANLDLDPYLLASLRSDRQEFLAGMGSDLPSQLAQLSWFWEAGQGLHHCTHSFSACAQKQGGNCGSEECESQCLMSQVRGQCNLWIIPCLGLCLKAQSRRKCLQIKNTCCCGTQVLRFNSVHRHNRGIYSLP